MNPVRSITQLAALSMLAACTATPGASGLLSPSPSASAPATPSATPATARYLVRLTTRSAIGPDAAFVQLPVVIIGPDRTMVSPGAVPAIYPGPLVSPLIGRSVSVAGMARIIAEARALGLAGGGSFAPDTVAPGAPVTTIELWLDERVVTLTGDAEARIVCIRAPCEPAPGTPAAFGAFARHLADLAAWMPEELGVDAPWSPAGYAVLLNVTLPGPMVPGAGVLVWPLKATRPLASFGVRVGGAASALRCGLVRGEEAAALRPLLAGANTLTQWIATLATSASHLMAVRPLIGGEDPCAEFFGVAGT